MTDKKVETKTEVKSKTKKCQSKLCENTFEVNERYIQEKFCPICICAAQSDMIRTYSSKFSAIAKAMGADFITNLIIAINEGKKPVEVALADGTRGFVMDPKLFRVGKSAGNRNHRRRMDKAIKKRDKSK